MFAGCAEVRREWFVRRCMVGEGVEMVDGTGAWDVNLESNKQLLLKYAVYLSSGITI